MAESVLTRELRRQAADARRHIQRARAAGDEFTAAAYGARLTELEEIAARNDSPLRGGCPA